MEQIFNLTTVEHSFSNKPLSTDLNFLELFTGSQNIVLQILTGGLNGTPTCLHCPLEILIRHSTSTKHVPEITQYICMEMFTGTSCINFI